MKSNAIISAIICFIFAAICILAAIANYSIITAIIGITIAFIGRNFYLSREM